MIAAFIDRSEADRFARYQAQEYFLDESTGLWTPCRGDEHRRTMVPHIRSLCFGTVEVPFCPPLQLMRTTRASLDSVYDDRPLLVFE